MSHRVALVLGVLTFLIVVAALIFGGIGLWLLAVVFGFTLFGWVVEEYVYVRVPEFQVAVVFNRETKAFERFLPAGRHWLLPPFLYQVKDMIKTASRSAKGTTTGARTADGIPVTVEWNMAYDCNPFDVLPGIEPKMARALPKAADNIAANHGNNVMQQILGGYTVHDMCREGIQAELENIFNDQLNDRIKIFGMRATRVMVLAIQLPHEVQMTIESAYKRELLAESDTKALQLLQRAVHEFSDRDMERLSELERLRLIGENGGGLAYLLASMVNRPIPVGEFEKKNQPANGMADEEI